MRRNSVFQLDLQILRCHELPKQVISQVCPIYFYFGIASIQNAVSVLLDRALS